MTLRVVIADDDRFVRALTVRVLSMQPGIEVVGEAESADQAVALATELAPDVVLLDVQMPGSGAAAARGIADTCAETVSVAYSASADSAVREMTAAGVAGYVLKGASGDELADALREAVSARAG